MHRLHKREKSLQSSLMSFVRVTAEQKSHYSSGSSNRHRLCHTLKQASHWVSRHTHSRIFLVEPLRSHCCMFIFMGILPWDPIQSCSCITKLSLVHCGHLVHVKTSNYPELSSADLDDYVTSCSLYVDITGKSIILEARTTQSFDTMCATCDLSIMLLMLIWTQIPLSLYNL